MYPRGSTISYQTPTKPWRLGVRPRFNIVNLTQILIAMDFTISALKAETTVSYKIIDRKGDSVKVQSSTGLTKIWSLKWLLQRHEEGDLIEGADGSFSFKSREAVTEEIFDAM